MELIPRDAELVVGLVARIGVDTKTIVETIRKELISYNYQVLQVHVTDSLGDLSSTLPLVQTPIEARYHSYIAACNKLRSDTRKNVMAMLAIAAIAENRDKSFDAENINRRRAFIVNQIKRPEEFELLRSVYGEQYVQISCHADEDARTSSLRLKISEYHVENPKDYRWDEEARKLVSTDESQEEEPNGQRVRQVFPLSDVIVDANSLQGGKLEIERFFRALFGDKSVTPTKEEYGMELASTASQRSSDLSRQVGAAILNSSMEIKALGSNEVPKAGGGTYWEGGKHDGRDFVLGYDSNEQRRRAVLLDLMFRLKNAGALADHLSSRSEIESFLFDRDDKVISDSQLMDSLEYGRTVHAEMNAITDAARGGHAIRDCILFTNTFPFHNCAKHIVAAGIEEVVYIHPYPKSYAKELFADSIEINPPSGQPTTHKKVCFRQFIGIVGPMYGRLFTKARWKKSDGKVPEFKKGDASYVRRTPNTCV